jgi:predicted MFS family arabinose efflux permease
VGLFFLANPKNCNLARALLVSAQKGNQLMEDILIPSLALIGFWGTMIIWIYFFFTSRTRIRQMLIESGQDAKIFRKGGDKRQSLKQGMLAVGVGIGLLLGNVLYSLGVQSIVAFASPSLILGGIALLGYYQWLSKHAEENDEVL